MDLAFVKMHGCGNDFVVVDDLEGTWDLDAAAVGFLCDRHFGIGADGIILVRRATEPGAEYLMHYINADGSLAEMCGNGVRVFAKYLFDRGLVAGDTIRVQTLGGLRDIRLLLDEAGAFLAARVDMGAPILEGSRIPTTLPGDTVIDAVVQTPAGDVSVTCVSMGNPHAIVWVDDVEDAPVETLGPAIENHPAFPSRTNVEFAQVLEADDAGDRIALRVWERGVGETLACGTGACATAVAGALTGRTGRVVRIELPGGDLDIEWSESGAVLMTGPAVEVYTGAFPIGSGDEECASTPS